MKTLSKKAKILSITEKMRKVGIKTNPTKLEPVVVGNKVFRSSCDFEMTPEDVEKARVELGETEEVRNESLKTLKEMLSRDETRYRTDDDYLLSFLRCRKFNCKEAYNMIRYLYSLKKDYPVVFTTVHPNMKEFLERKLFSFLPYRDEEGSTIILDFFGKWDPRKESIFDLFQYFHPLGEIFLMNPSCQINKIVVIIDCEGAGITHALPCLNPRLLMFWPKVMQSMYTQRLKRILIVNCNKVFETVLKAVRHLLKRKIYERVIIIGSDVTEIHQYIDPAVLPKRYGGSLEDDEWGNTEVFMDNLHYITYEHSFPQTSENTRTDTQNVIGPNP